MLEIERSVSERAKYARLHSNDLRESVNEGAITDFEPIEWVNGVMEVTFNIPAGAEVRSVLLVDEEGLPVSITELKPYEKYTGPGTYRVTATDYVVHTPPPKPYNLIYKDPKPEKKLSRWDLFLKRY